MALFPAFDAISPPVSGEVWSVLATIFDKTTDYVVQTDSRGNITYMNPAARQVTGLALEESVTLRNFAEFYPVTTMRRFAEEIIPAVQAGGVWVGETTVNLANRGEVPISHMVIAHRDAGGRVAHYSSVMRDISAQVVDKRELLRQTETLRAVAEAIPAIVAVVGADGRYRFVNSAFERWRGVPRDRIIGCTLLEVLGQADCERSLPWVKRALAGETVNFERDYPEGGHATHLAMSYIPLRLDGAVVDGFVGVGQDITLHKREEMRLLQLAQRDALTGVLNRSGIEQYLVHRLREGAGAFVALLYIDLDHFKPINDRHGHAVGDQVLQMFALRLRSLVRPTDAVARLGGDEFALLLSDVHESGNAHAVAAKVVAAAHLPFELGPLSLNIGASVGVAFGADPVSGWKDLMARADAMLYQAKAAGRGRQEGAAP